VAYRAQQLTVTLLVWNVSTNSPQLGAATQLNLRVIKDNGVAANAANAPVELENGLYALTLTDAEMDADFITAEGTCTVPNTVVIPVKVSPGPSAKDIADEILCHPTYYCDEVQGTLAWYIRLLVQAHTGKVESDEDANTVRIFDPDGDVMVTLTYTKLGSVITRLPS